MSSFVGIVVHTEVGTDGGRLGLHATTDRAAAVKQALRGPTKFSRLQSPKAIRLAPKRGTPFLGATWRSGD